MLSSAACTLNMCYCANFWAGNALFTLPNLTFWKSVWSTAIYGMSSSGEFVSKLIYTLHYTLTVVWCQWTEAHVWHGIVELMKVYWQCNWWVALASLSMSVAYNGHYEQLLWQYQYLFSHMTWNIEFFNTHDTLLSSIFCNTAWNWISNISQGSAATYVRWRVAWLLLGQFLLFLERILEIG